MSYGTDPLPVDVPKRFDGTPEEARANFDTHQWVTDGDTPTCAKCDARTYHEAANYPCGVEPPRVIVYVDYNESTVYKLDDDPSET